MPLIKASTDTVRIDLPADGEWVEVKASLSRADERLVQRKVLSAARVGVAGDTFDLDAGLAYDAAEFATLETAIVRWSFKDAITPNAIRCLDDASVDALKAKLDELYPGELPESEKNG